MRSSRPEKLSLDDGVYPDFDTPLVFIDPVDSTRNVSSALSPGKYDLFLKACQAYCQQPRETFFFPNALKPWSLKRIQSELRGKEFIGLRFPKPDIIPENLYPQVRKAVRSLHDKCEEYDFHLLDSFFHLSDTSIYIVLQPQNHTISPTKIHHGPPVTLEKNADEFKEKWNSHPRTVKKPYEKHNRLYVEIDREYTCIEDLIRDQISSLRFGKHLDIMVKDEYTLLHRNDLLKNNLCLMWTEHLDSTMPWER